MQNYRSAFIEGTISIQAFTFKDHAATDIYQWAIILEAKSTSVMEYTMITRVMAHTNLSEADKVKIKRKMDTL